MLSLLLYVLLYRIIGMNILYYIYCDIELMQCLLSLCSETYCVTFNTRLDNPMQILHQTVTMDKCLSSILALDREKYFDIQE